MDRIKEIIKRQKVYYIWFIVFIIIASVYKLVAPTGYDVFISMCLSFLVPLMFYVYLIQCIWFYFDEIDYSIRMGVTRKTMTIANVMSILIYSLLASCMTTIIIIAMNYYEIINISISILEVFKVFVLCFLVYMILFGLIATLILVCYKLSYRFSFMRNFVEVLRFIIFITFTSRNYVYKLITNNVIEFILVPNSFMVFLGIGLSIIIYLAMSKTILQIDAR